MNKMRTMKRICIVLFFTIGFAAASLGQYHIGYTQFYKNEYLINPSYATKNDYFSVALNVRQQWIGIEGAPQTHSLSFNGPYFSENSGIGISLINDRIGKTRQQLLNLSYAHSTRLGKDVVGSVGLNFGARYLGTDFSSLNLEDEQDVNFNLDRNQKLLFLFGTGMNIQGKNYNAGFSIPVFMNNSKMHSSETLPVENKVFAFMDGTYYWKLKENMFLQASTLVKFLSRSSMEVDLIGIVHINNEWNVGLSYKSLNSVSVLGEYVFKSKWALAYSYDIAANRLLLHQKGSHEVTLTYLLLDSYQKKYVNPRYF